MIIPILKYGAPELRTVSAPVTNIDGKLHKLVQDMIETMYAAPGIGLAAPQIGQNVRLFTADLSGGKEKNGLIVVVNPEIIATEGKQIEFEGCLSVPDFSAKVSRPKKVVLKGVSLQEKEILIEAGDLLARCFCHEMDHLNGNLYLDKLSSLKRNLIVRKIKKLQKEGAW